MIEKNKRMVIIAGYLCSVGLSICFLILFFGAYFFGGMEALMTINDYGEAHVELLLVSVLISIIFLGFYYLYKLDKELLGAEQ